MLNGCFAIIESYTSTSALLACDYIVDDDEFDDKFDDDVGCD
jgi:hypothetical protein